MFGQNKTFSFGAATSAGPTATTTTTTGFGGFGATTQSGTTAANSTFSSFGGFGRQATAPTTGTTSAFNFGQTAAPAATGGGLFGSTATTTQTNQPTTGLFGTTNTGTGSLGTTGGFGTTATSQPSTGFGGFGGFGTTTTTSSGFSSFGGFNTQPTTTTSGFGTFGTTGAPAAGTGTTSFNFSLTQPQQQQQQQQQAGMFGLNTTANVAQVSDNLMNSLVSAQIFNDDRDLILAKWNQLQAFYGFGKIFYQNQTINAAEDNRLTRFKTIGYSCKPSNKNEDGLVCLVVKSNHSEIKANQSKFVESLSKIFGSSPTLQIEIDSIKPLVREKAGEKVADKIEPNSLVTFYIIERAATGQTRRIPSLDVFNHLNKQEVPTQTLGSLTTKNAVKDQLNQLNVISVYPLVQLNEEQIKEYLEKPPSGVNPILWEQAKRNNPNPDKLIPVPIVGFQELNKRFKLQEQESQAQKSCLYKIKDDIDAINTKNKLLMNKIEQYKSKNEELEHRLLKVMINYEIRRKLGICFQEDEKYLRNVLESLYIELSSPINKEIQKQKLSEFLEIVKTYELTHRQYAKNDDLSMINKNKYDLMNIEDMQKSLREQHKIFKSLIEIINKDLTDINIIKKNLKP